MAQYQPFAPAPLYGVGAPSLRGVLSQVYYDTSSAPYAVYVWTPSGWVAFGGSAPLFLPVTKTVTSDELKAIHTTPKLIVDAPGAGLIVIPWMVFGRMKNSTANYQNTLAPGLYWNAVSGQVTFSDLFTDLATMAADFTAAAALPTFDGSADNSNQPLVFTDLNDWTTGDGDMVLKVYYSIEEVTS